MATDEGISLVRLLHDRYGMDEEEELHFVQVVVARAPQHRAITGGGGLVVPQCLGLDGQNVSSLGDIAELRSLCANVTELDIASNRLNDWTQVLMLLHAMPKLQFLNLSNNPLSENASGSFSECLATVTKDNCRPDNPTLSRLILSATGVTWPEVWELLDLLPSVNELHLARNAINSTVLPSSGQVYPGIRQLFAPDNYFSDMRDVLALGRIFPNLEHLIVMANPLEELSCDPDVCREAFPLVRLLNISYTRIADWSQLESLRHWPNLSQLRCQNIPFLDAYDADTRLELTMAYLPQITQLNGSPVTDAERDIAERAFIRRYMDQESKPDRYHELHKLHGDLDPLAAVEMDAKKTVTVTVNFQEKSTLHTFDVNLTLKQLKKELGTLLDVSPRGLKVWHCDPVLECGADIMRYEERTLLRYRVFDGNEFLVIHQSDCDPMRSA